MLKTAAKGVRGSVKNLSKGKEGDLARGRERIIYMLVWTRPKRDKKEEDTL